MRILKQVIIVGDSLGIVLDKIVVNTLKIKVGNKLILDVYKIKRDE